MLPGTLVLMAQTPQPSAPVGGRSPALCSRLRQRIISRLDLPSAARLATYSLVRPSCLMRTTQIRCRQRLASRSPPLLSRCLTTFPEDASMGETPQRLAKEASLFRRCGLSPRPHSAASLHGPYRCPGGRSALGRHPPPADPTVHRVGRFLRRGAGSAVPPSAARTSLLCTRH